MKKRHLHRTLAGLMAVSLVLSFTACSKTTGSSSQTGTQSGASATDDPYKPDDSKTYEISIMQNANWPVDSESDLLARWNQKFNVKLNIINFDPSNAQEQLNLKITSGETPDVFFVNTVSLNNYQKQGALAKISDEALQKYLPLCMAQLEKEAPGITSYGYIDNERYGLPDRVFYYNDFRAPVIYNGVWMKKVGATKAPATLSDLEALLTKFANSDPDGNGQKDTYGISNTSMSVVFGAYGVSNPRSGGQWVVRDGKVVYDATLPETKQALQKLNEWYKAGIIDPQFITGENTGGYWAITQAFINQQIGLTSMGSLYHWSPEMPGRAEGQDLTELKKANKELSENLVFGTPVTGPSGKGGIATASVINDQYMVFGSQLDNDKGKMGKVLQIADYLNGTCTEDTYLAAFYGIKGKDWDLNADGSLKMITSNEELVKRGAWGTLQFVGLGQNNSFPEKALVEWGNKNGFSKKDCTTYESVLTPLATIPSMAQYTADLSKIVDTAAVSIITGDKPIDYFDTFVSDWKASGGDQLTKEINEWYASKK